MPDKPECNFKKMFGIWFLDFAIFLSYHSKFSGMMARTESAYRCN